MWWAIGLGLVALVIYLSLTPYPPDAPKVEGFALGHFMAYFALMGWWAQLATPGRARLVVAMVLVGMGVGLECLQMLVPNRTFDLDDMRDNALGVGAAFVVTLSPLGEVLVALERRLAGASR